MIAFIWFIPSKTKAQQLDSVLKELIGKGLEKSHSVNIHNFNIEQSKVDQKIAKTVFLPKLTFNASFTRLNDDITFNEDTQNLLSATQKLLIKEAVGIPFNNAFPENIPLAEIPSLQSKDILKSSVNLDWVLFSGFEVSNAIKASKHKETSLKYVQIAEKDKIALKIIEAYDKLVLVKKAIENGLATPISRKKIEFAQQQLIAKQLDFNHNKILLVEVLHQLTGENKERLILLNPTLQSFSMDLLSNTEKRNEIKALEEAEKATLYKSKMEKSNFIPKLALKGHYEFMEDDLSLLEPKWYLGAGIKWNVFDGGQSLLKSKKSKIESQKFREQIKDANEMIALGIFKAELTYESSLQNMKIIQKEIELASDTYEMVDKQYKNDLTSINDVLDALNDLEKANFKLQESYFNQRRAVTDLLHTKGILNYEYN